MSKKYPHRKRKSYKRPLGKLDVESSRGIQNVNELQAGAGGGKLPNNLKLIDQHLNLIRNNGRQVFLQNIPENFSRILHDYNDEKKGIILWRDSLEERLS